MQEMSTNKTLDKYKGFPLHTEAVVRKNFKIYLETCLGSEEEACNHSFHKILVSHWPEDLNRFISKFSDYYGFALIPVNVVREKVEGDHDILTLYTSNLNLISKIIQLNYLLPYQKCMYNIQIIFNHKTSYEIFGEYTTIEEIVSRVVSNRFTKTCTLDLSSFCKDKEFEENKIYFYKLSLLSHFKILMLRMGRDTISLDLSHNNLSVPPIEVVNFFIKGKLKSVNLSHNDIKTLNELYRINNKIEKLWLEGNPLCEEFNVISYVKSLLQYFPKLTELDGVRLNPPPFYFPFERNFLLPTTLNTKYIVDRFLSVFYFHYDDHSRTQRKHLVKLYDFSAKFSISCSFTPEEEPDFEHYLKHSQNTLTMPERSKFCTLARSNCHSLVLALMIIPETVHDPTTFCVDVLCHDEKRLIFVVDGIFKEVSPTGQDKILQFRRTFVLGVKKMRKSFEYLITNDMFSITTATEEQKQNSFRHPIRNLSKLMLFDPTTNDIETLITIFCQLTKLKTWMAEERLRKSSWDLRLAILTFSQDFKKNEIPNFCFEDDDIESVDLTELMDEID